jgi:hypothetical protein
MENDAVAGPLRKCNAARDFVLTGFDDSRLARQARAAMAFAR